MKALVYQGPGPCGWDTVDDPTIIDSTDTVAFTDAANPGAVKAVLEGSEHLPSSHDHIAADLVAGPA